MLLYGHMDSLLSHLDLSDRRILVTGASSGIGAATAAACARAGAGVAWWGRDLDRLRRHAGADATVVTGDVTDPAAVDQAVDEAATALGGLDGVINSAGIMRLGLIAQADPADWRAMLDTNVYGLLLVTRAVIPHLRAAGRGDVVNVSSMSGRRLGSVEAGVYAASKAAVHMLSEGLRQELGPDGIRVTVISPGLVRTPIGRHSSDRSAYERVERVRDRVGLDADEVGYQITAALALPHGTRLHEVALLPTAQE